MKTKPYDLISFALQWVEIPEFADQSYLDGVLDAAAHIAACYLAQKFNVSVPTSDMRDILEVGDSGETVKKKLAEYMSESS